MKNQRGMALMLAIFTVLIATYLAVEVSYESNVEYIVNANSVSRIKAYYAARSGVQLSLFRIKLYQAAMAQFGKDLGPNAKMLDLIWSFPLAWPPVAPASMTGVNKDQIQKLVKESKMDASYMAVITEEGSRLDLNDLISPSKKLRESARQRILNLFTVRMEQDEKFRREHGNERFEDLVNRIIDWGTSGTQAVDGGDKKRYYERVEDVDPFPPNRAFRSVGELRLVAGMTEEYFKILEPQVTVYGTKAINPNYATAEVLKGLDISMTDKVVSHILNRRESRQAGEGPFVAGKDGSCATEFWSFVNSHEGRVSTETQNNTPISCDPVYNFRITSTGSFGSASRTIYATVFDLQKTLGTVAETMKKENTNNNAGNNNNANNPNGQNGTKPAQQSSSPGQSNSPSKGAPRIVYWSEI